MRGRFYDYLDEGAVVAAEWSENFADLLALEDPIHINIERWTTPPPHHHRGGSMNILAVDTAGKTVGVALFAGRPPALRVLSRRGHDPQRDLMPLIDNCLKLCGMGCKDIDLYGINAGPGSFTGLRIGLAAVKGPGLPRETLCPGVHAGSAGGGPHRLRHRALRWMPAVRRCTARLSTLRPTSVRWTTMPPAPWLTWPSL